MCPCPDLMRTLTSGQVTPRITSCAEGARRSPAENFKSQNTENKKTDTMHQQISLKLIAMALLSLGVALSAGKAVGQQAGSTLKDQLVGTWMLVSNYTEREDGSKVETFGPNPKGILMVDGHLSLQEVRSDLPKFASNDRQEGTTEENKAIVQGSIGHFGRYTLDEGAKTLTIHLEGCSFPNWTGTDLKRSITLTGDELTWSGVGLALRKSDATRIVSNNRVPMSQS
jgi:hypothetical protein